MTIQLEVCKGLIQLTDLVINGKYGEDNEVFRGDEDCDGLTFLSDMHDLVIDKM